MPPAALLPAQTRLGGYEIMELVGRGGMGEVYRARQVSMDRIVALKVLSPRLAAKDPSFAQQFIAEARAAGRLNHAHIVHVHDVASALAPEGCGVAGELHYFSMEFIDGETVKDVLERQGRLEPDQVARVMRGMGEALVYAQSQDLIHRDIKPDNIMLGSDGSVKLADLGLATDLETATNEAGGKVMGTPLYMSPEQARALALDHRSDQYSLGATLFHCLTGRPPYTGDSAKGIMKAHVVEPVPDPRALREDVPEAWRQLCLRLMAKEPAARFPDAVAMRLAIEAAAQGRAVRARTATAHPAHRRPPRRSPLLVGAVAAGVVAAVAVAAVVASGGGEAPSSPVPPPADLSTRPATVAARPAAEPPAPSLEDALARLPREPRQRLEGLRALIDGPFRASPERRRIDAMIRDLEGDLAAAAARTAAERADRFTKGLAAAESALAAGRLADAGDQIAALKPADAGEDGAAKVADLRARLDQALARARGGFDERIAAADDVRTLDGIAGELRAAALPAPEARRLDAAIATRRAALSSAAAAADAEHLERVVAAVEEQRRTPRYAELQARLTQLMAPIQGPEGRATADRYLRAVRLAAQVEADIQAHIKAKEPEATLRLAAGQTATVRLTALGPDRVSFRRGSAAPVTAERAGIELPLADLAAAAAAAGPERGDALTAFAWHWRLPALTGTGDRAFAAQLAEHDRRLRPLPV
ncbi:MAG: hypothetical protein RLZZ127_1258, partial [Planctomycetota bacterium]